NQPHGAAERDVVGALDPVEILTEMVDGRIANRSDRVSVPIGEVAQPGCGSLLNSRILGTQAREAVVKIADQIGAEDAGVADGVPLVGGKQNSGGWVAGKLREPVRVAIVLKIAAPEDCVISSIVNVIVELGGVGVPIERRGGVENESGCIEAIADGGNV